MFSVAGIIALGSVHWRGGEGLLGGDTHAPLWRGRGSVWLVYMCSLCLKICREKLLFCWSFERIVAIVQPQILI